jgi:WD40 repeat protein
MPRRYLSLVALLLAGCHRGHGGLSVPPGITDGEASPGMTADAGGAPASDTNPAPEVAPDATVPDGAADAAVLTADTVWKACGNLASEMTALAHSPDGKRVAVGYGDGRVTLIDVPGMTVAGHLDTAARFGVQRLAFTADGGTLVSVAGGSLKLWAVPSGTFQRELGSAVGAGTSLQVSGGAMPVVMVASTALPSVKLWRLDGPFLGMMGDGTVAAFTDEGQAVVVVSQADPAGVAVLGLDGKMIRRFTVPLVRAAALSGDGTLVAAAIDQGASQQVELYSTRTGKRLWRSTDGVKDTRQLAFLESPPRVVQLGEVGADSFVYDAATGKTLGPLPYRQALQIDPAPGGGHLMAITHAGRLARVAVADGTSQPGPGSEFGVMERILGIDVTRDGRYVAAAGLTATWLFDLRENTLLRVLEVPGFKPHFSPDGAALAMGGLRRAIYKVGDGTAVNIDTAEARPCLPSLVFSPDGQTLASGTCGKIELFRPDGTRLGERPSSAIVAGVAWSPDGKRLATTGPELWPAEGSAPLWPAMVAPAPDNGAIRISDNVAAFSPDGKVLALSRSLGYLPYAEWDTMTDLVAASDGSALDGLGRRLGRRPSFSPDGSWLVGGGYAFHINTRRSQPLTSDRAASRFLPDNRILAVSTEGILRLYCPSRP